MEQSLFSQWVDKYFKPLVAKIVEKINGSSTPATYLHKSMLKKEFSPTLKWSSINVDGTTVAADIVALDSELPLKKRDAISKADGDLPKLGMKLYLNERTMTDLNILVATQGQESQIVQKLFADTKRVIDGVYEKLELMFLQALSTGITLIEDDKNVGVGVRIDFGYKAGNKFGAAVVWSSTSTATPITDIERILEVARTAGHTIVVLMMDRFAFNNFRKTAEVKELFAAGLGFNGANIPTPNLDQINDSMSSNYGLTIQIVDRAVKVQRDGTNSTIRPWAEGAVVFLTTTEVGTLTYGTLAEENYKAKHVDYQKADDFILVSKYHKNDPIREFTSSQALVLPVINGVDSIYLLDTKTVQA